MVQNYQVHVGDGIGKNRKKEQGINIHTHTHTHTQLSSAKKGFLSGVLVYVFARQQ